MVDVKNTFTIDKSTHRRNKRLWNISHTTLYSNTAYFFMTSSHFFYYLLAWIFVNFPIARGKKSGELFYDDKYMKCMRCTFVQYVRSFLAQYFKLVWYILSWGCWTYQTISLDFMRYYYRYQLHWFDLIHISNGQFIIITLIRFFLSE